MAVNRREVLLVLATGGAAALATAFGMTRCRQDSEEPQPTAIPTDALPFLTPTVANTLTPSPSAIPTSTATALVAEMPTVPAAEAWPMDVDAATRKWGGSAADWSINPDWDGTRSIVAGYNPVEWRTSNPEDIGWPQTPEEAIARFYPDDAEKIDARFMQEAWRNDQGVVIGWHFSEDHWITMGSQELTLHLPAGAVLEGYTARATSEPEDDRNFVIVGPENAGTVQLILHRNPEDMQGFTVWMPGTPPEKIALSMELYRGADVPHYLGASGEQLGPIAVGWVPEHYEPAGNDLPFLNF